MTTPEMIARIDALEAQVKHLHTLVMHLQSRMNKPLTAKAIRADAKRQRYSDLERTLTEVFDLHDLNAELTPEACYADEGIFLY